MIELANDDKIRLDLPFRGERNYLHSTTILEDILAIYGPVEDISLNLRKMIFHPIYLASADEDQITQVGAFSFKVGSSRVKKHICCDLQSTVEARVSCNERTIISRYDTGSLYERGIVGAPGNMVEMIVALNKAIVARNTDARNKIIFSTLKLDYYSDRGEVGVRLVKKLGSKLFVSAVDLDGKVIGELVFMAV